MKKIGLLLITFICALNVDAQQIEPQKGQSDLLVGGIHLRNSAMREYAGLTAICLGTGYYLLHGTTTNWAPEDRTIGNLGLFIGYATGVACYISAIEMRRKAGRAIMDHEGWSLKASPTAFSLKYSF